MNKRSTQSAELQMGSELVLKGLDAEAMPYFERCLKKETDSAKLALAHLALGRIQLRLGSGDPELHFRTAIELGAKLSDFAYYYLGELAYQKQDYASARKNLEKAIALGLPAQNQVQARVWLAEIAFEEKQYRQAQVLFTKLRKQKKGQLDYPKILVALGRTERKIDPRKGGCRNFKEVWSKYPTSVDWEGPLSRIKVDGVVTGCPTTEKDFQLRIRRLQAGGDSAKALREIQARQDLVGYSRDQLLAQYLIQEGSVNEALELLLKNFDQNKDRVPYLNLLAKATARANEALAATAFYERVYRLAGRGKAGREALFQAAFNSYLFQDYDGASEKFQEYLRVFGRSRKASEAQWYLAWMQYLRGNYDSAYRYFDSMSKLKSRRSRRAAPVEMRERYLYWMAMTLVRQGKTEEALVRFHQLSLDPNLGYYSLAAFHRVEQLLSEHPEWRSKVNDSAKLPNIWSNQEEAESEVVAESGAEDEAPEGEDESETTEVAGAEENTAETEDAMPVEAPIESKISKKYERSLELLAIGMKKEAREEMQMIERSARIQEEKRTLMNELEKVDGFYRSSYIAETTFGIQRIREGVRNARPLWEACYPHAFKEDVERNANEAQVPKEFVWAIMRAESHFKIDAQSPVGALGLMQLMPFTARNMASVIGHSDFQIQSLFDPSVNVRLGAFYLGRLLRIFEGQIPLAAAAYNAGPHRVLSWIHFFGNLEMDAFVEHIPFLETRNYVKKVVRNYHAYLSTYSGNSRQTRWLIDSIQRESDIPPANTPVW